MSESSSDAELMSEECPKHSLPCVMYCDPCRDDDKHIQATGFCVDCNDFLCTECYNAHRRARPFKNHILLDKENMPTHKTSKVIAIEKCKGHQDESVKWHCGSHDEIFCDLCKQVDHRKCEGVKTITEMGQNISNKRTLVRDRLIQLQKSFREKLSEVTENTESVERYYSAAVEEITKSLSEIRKRDIEVMKVLELTCDTTMKAISSMLNELGEGTGETVEHNFLATRKAESQVRSFEERLTSVMKDNRITRYTYVPETSYPPHKEPSSAGTVIGTIQEVKDDITPVKLECINVKTQSDKRNCGIKGMDILSDNRLLIADYKNATIELVDIAHGTVISELKLGMSPWDLTKIDDKKVAITTYTNRKILVVSTASDTLTIQKTIDKREFEYCQGIVSYNDTLIVSFYRPICIQVLDMDGTVKQNIENKDEAGTVIFGDVEYIAYSSSTNTLYLSDTDYNTVLRMTMDGKVIASYKHDLLKKPKGITVGRDGRIYVCCRDTNMIFEITGDLSEGHVILDESHGIVKPYSIVYNETDHRLFVGLWDNNTVHVFRV